MLAASQQEQGCSNYMMLAASQQEQRVQQEGQPCHGSVALHVLAGTAGRPADAGLGNSQVLTLRLG